MSNITLEESNYQGLVNGVWIRNQSTELFVATGIGPRILHYSLIGGPNHLKVYPEDFLSQDTAVWKIYGGHRLWISPEIPEYTYHKDHLPCDYEIKGTMLFVSSVDSSAGILKEMEISIEEVGSNVSIRHKVYNKNKQPMKFAAWSLTVMAEGGTEIIPQSQEGSQYAPNRCITFWPYSKLNDIRLRFGEKYIFIDQRTDCATRFKIGMKIEDRWAAYANNEQLFVKRFDYKEDEAYPYFGVAPFETFTNQTMLEMESLSPVSIVDEGEHIEHVEQWELHAGVLSELLSEEWVEQQCLTRFILKQNKQD